MREEPPPWVNEEVMCCPRCGREYPLSDHLCQVCGSPLVRKTIRVPLEEI